MKKKTNRVGNTFYFLPAISQPADMLELGENGDAHCFYYNSSIEKQYLYYLLLSDKVSGIEKHEALIASLSTNVALRCIVAVSRRYKGTTSLSLSY